MAQIFERVENPWRSGSPASEHVLLRAFDQLWWWSQVLKVSALASWVLFVKLGGQDALARLTGTDVRGHATYDVSLLSLIGIAAFVGVIGAFTTGSVADRRNFEADSMLFLLSAALLPLAGPAMGLVMLATLPGTIIFSTWQATGFRKWMGRWPYVVAGCGAVAIAAGTSAHSVRGSNVDGGLAIACGVGALAVTIVMAERWWKNQVYLSFDVDDIASPSREHRLAAVLHDGTVPILERVAAGHQFSLTERQNAAALAESARFALLGDHRPRSIARMVNAAVTQAQLQLDVVLVRMECIVAEPPTEVVECFADALAVLVLNLSKAQVTQANLIVDADADSLHVTLSDAGVGRDPRAPWGPTTQRRVVEPITSIPGGSAEVETAPGLGVTWRLSWNRLESHDGNSSDR